MGLALFARTTTSVAVLAMLLPLSTGGAAASEAEDAGPDAAGVVRQLEGIRDELRSIVELLGAVEEQQRVTALMTRIRLKQQRLSSIEGQLRSARAEQEAAEQEIERLTAVEKSWTEGKGEGLADEERRALELMRQERKNLASRVETLRLRVVELENDLSRAQDEILALEETVDEQLGLR